MQRAETIESGSVQSLLNRIWQRKALFATVFGAVIALTVVALLVLPVRYIATGSVIVAEQEPSANNMSAAWAQKIGDPADLESQLLVIRSPRVMRLTMTPQVIDAVTEECQYNSQAGFRSLLSGSSESCEKLKTDGGAFIDYVKDRYVVGAVGRSRVINISYQSPIAAVAKTMADALTSAFLEDQRSANSSNRETASSYLRQELAQLDTELRDADARIQAFRRDKGLMRGSIAPISSERLTSISQQLSTAESARADAAARLQEIKANQARGANDAPAVLSSRAVADLKQQLTIISSQLASQANVLGPRHPALRALEREQALVQQRLAAEVTSIAASAQKTLDANDALVKSLKKQMDATKSEVASATSDEASIESMVRGAEIKRQQYTELYKRASELETERRVLIGSTRLVSLAELPNKPFFPKKIPFLAAGSLIGLLLAAAACLTFKRPVSRDRPVRAPTTVVTSAPARVAPPAPLVDPVRTKGPPSELATATGAPIFARLPRLKSDAPASAIGAILTGDSEPPLARALQIAKTDRQMQDGLQQLDAGLVAAGGTSSRRKIFITSAGSGEGKTFMTLALGQMLAARGQRVLVVECDTRFPAFATALGIDGGAGLQGVLSGNISPQQAMVRTGTPNLDAIVAGRPVNGSVGGLLRKPMSDLLSWASSYDAVLIDGPPPGVLSDASMLADQVDGVLLCTRWGRSSIGSAVAAISGIKAAGGKVFGMAVTMVKPDGGSATGAVSAKADAYIGAT